jgi:EAL domain-containing protein (putative c-di-GMP-specific phosphodiesterase class I)
LDEAQEKSKQLIDAIVLLGSRLGISITAEGVETDDQRDILNKLGCNVLQDYLFGKPAPMQLDIGAKRQTSNL